MVYSLERFAALCASLRRNDRETTELFRLDPPPDAYGRLLGDALEGNTHVSSISLRLCNALAADEGVDSAARLLRYLSESVSVRKITLRYENDPPRPEVVAALLRLALCAIAESSHIEELLLSRYDTIVAPPDVIAQILRTTQSLKKLCIQLGDFDGVASRELVADAFGANRTLECLTFVGNCSSRTVEAVLVHLGSHPCLRVLKLFCGRNASVAQLRAMNHFLRTTISLEQLDLWFYVFDEECMEHFVEGLQSSQSLLKLSFKGCKFDFEAATLFQGCMQTDGTRSSIRELCFENSEGMFAGSTTGRAAAAFLTVPETRHMGSCIASSLHVLEFDEKIEGFYDTLAANAFRIRLPRVHHTNFYYGEACWEAIVRCLPKLVYLWELRLPDSSPQESITRSFIDAMRQNGSLRDVNIVRAYPYREREPVFDVAQDRLIRSCCKRNEVIPILVANPRPDATAIALFPKLFVAARQARRTAPNAILLGLLAAGDDIGPRLDRKRLNQGPSA